MIDKPKYAWKITNKKNCSFIAGAKFNNSQFDFKEGEKLSYKINEWTEAPNCGPIFCYRTIEIAREFKKRNRRIFPWIQSKLYKVEIKECTRGKYLTFGFDFWGSACQYPAIVFADAIKLLYLV